MSTIVIRPPNLKKLRGEQEQMLATLPSRPGSKSVYLRAPLLQLSSVYHSRGCTPTIEAPPSRRGLRSVDDAGRKSNVPLLPELFNAAPRVDLDVEKTLSLACHVLQRARMQSPELSGEARRSLRILDELRAGCTAAILPNQ